MNPQVFLSYSHIDSAIADDLAHALDDAGVTYFRDVKDIAWGESITSKIHDAVRSNAHLFRGIGREVQHRGAAMADEEGHVPTRPGFQIQVADMGEINRT